MKRYEVCHRCQSLTSSKAQTGHRCNGPNFLACDIPELAEWCREHIRILGEESGITVTPDKITTETGISKTTVYSFLNGHKDNFNWDTARAIVNCVCGGASGDYPCGSLSENEREAYERRIDDLKSVIDLSQEATGKELRWRDDKIRYLENDHVRILEDLSGRVGRHHETLTHLRDENKRKNRIITMLGIICAVLLIAILSALVIDVANPGLGFIWFAR